MQKQKRTPHSYKVVDKIYEKAMRRAKKEKVELATLIEVWVIAYATKSDFLICAEPPSQVFKTNL